MAQLLDGNSFHRDKNTVPYFSPIRLRDVCTFAEKQQRGRNARARVGISGHARQGDRRKFPRVRASFALRALRVRSQPLFFLSNGGKGEDIVIRSRITCSLNDLT